MCYNPLHEQNPPHHTARGILLYRISGPSCPKNAYINGARKQKHGTAECRLLIELKVVLRMILLQYEAIALAVAELLLAGDDILMSKNLS